jgi:hypothetical protein
MKIKVGDIFYDNNGIVNFYQVVQVYDSGRVRIREIEKEEIPTECGYEFLATPVPSKFKPKREYDKNDRYANNVGYKLRCIISTAVRRSLLNEKDDSIKNLLGYSIQELKEHLEAQFEDWMTWDNLGLTAKELKQTWQIDHIKPVNTFNITSTDCEDFKKCWALENLRPLDSYINATRPDDGSDIKE